MAAAAVAVDVAGPGLLDFAEVHARVLQCQPHGVSTHLRIIFSIRIAGLEELGHADADYVYALCHGGILKKFDAEQT